MDVGTYHLCYMYVLDCRVGEFVTQHHNEIKYALRDISAIVHREALHECFARKSNDSDHLILID